MTNDAAHDCDADRKLYATLQAKLALRGMALQQLADGSYLVAAWTLIRPLPDLRAVAEFVRAIGAAS